MWSAKANASPSFLSRCRHNASRISLCQAVADKKHERGRHAWVQAIGTVRKQCRGLRAQQRRTKSNLQKVAFASGRKRSCSSGEPWQGLHTAQQSKCLWGTFAALLCHEESGKVLHCCTVMTTIVVKPCRIFVEALVLGHHHHMTTQFRFSGSFSKLNPVLGAGG